MDRRPATRPKREAWTSGGHPADPVPLDGDDGPRQRDPIGKPASGSPGATPAARIAAGARTEEVAIEPPEGARGDGPGAPSAEADESDIDVPMPSAERLIAQAVTLADADHEAATLVDRFWRFAAEEELIGYSAGEMLAAARAHRELAECRLPGELKLRITAPGDGHHHTVIEIVTDDMPFLVDSTTALLAERNLDLHLLVHPLVVVRREPLGRLTEVAADVEPDDAIDGDLVESWMRIEIDPIRDPADRDRLRGDLQRILTDVREAVEDWPRMRQRALALADELDRSGQSSAGPPVPERDISDSVALLRWLVDDHFTFLGYREYRLVDAEEPGRLGRAGPGRALAAVLGTGLGILRQHQTRPRPLASMTPEAAAKVLEKRLLIITKANSRATVHRATYLDYIAFKVFDARGDVVGERRFLGLFSTAAYRTTVRELPVVRRKVAEVLERSGLSPRSHSGKDLLQILEAYPRDELFQIRTEDLYQSVVGVLRMAGRRQLRLFLRRDGYGRFISCLIYLPRDRFTTQSRLRMQDILLRELNGVGVDHTTRATESMLARVHFIVRTDPARPPGQLDADSLAELLADATRLWNDDFRLVLHRKLGDEQAKRLFRRYANAFPEGYKQEQTPYEAVKDLAKVELLEEPGQLAMHLFRPASPAGPDVRDVRFKVYRCGEPMVLSAVLPVLHSLGVQVVDERPYEINRDDGRLYLYDFGLRLPVGARALAEVRPHVENAFSAAWRGEAEIDDFNELVLRAGLTWRQVVVLRAYAKYLRQAGTVFSQEYMESTFIAYPAIAALLVTLFETRFSPTLTVDDDRRRSQGQELVAIIGRHFDEVDSLDQDRILRSYLNLILATLRTNFYQRTSTGRPTSYVAFKLNPQAIPELPAPRPTYEIFVYSPRFEGVHLRFGEVARGGLRWSDRREDFRTEVLGLVKAQMVKNAVIVPVGAKGGFVVKQSGVATRARPGRDVPDREAAQAEGVGCYQQFISGLLDVTDNIVGGGIVPPPRVVRHDGDDPYLVVAADKGTAAFSDVANAISQARGFWLGDAFASGGSAGYDHKRMGITARGAWESVKRHFRELGRDIQRETFSVVGVGDMSGDVFGNAMLLSEHIRLVAAFDHRHIFLDPDPDPAISHAERRRLFDLPGSSWADYDPELISAGGGVYPRTGKSVPITRQVRAALGFADAADVVSPPELIRAILRAPVDLLFNGGIGTYVKASTESHADAGDKSNDAIRIDGRSVRARVVGEGGNLGLTQRGRIEYATAGGSGAGGGRICTDFIDNSAGVDCSDHEVNIKILLGEVVADGELTVPQRDALLADMTDEVADLVLRDNYDQARALANARAQAALLLPVHRRMITDLEESGQLDRDLEALPADEDLAARAAAGDGLTLPEFAVLMAYTKIALEREVLADGLADDTWTERVLVDYFPTPLGQRYAERMASHRLRREIVVTSLVNEVVNRGGISFVYRTGEETGASAAEVIRAYVVVRDVFGLGDLWTAVDALDNVVATEGQTAVYLESRRLLDRAVRWLVTNRRSPLDVPGEIERLRPGVSRLLPELGTLFRGDEREALRAQVVTMTDRGLPADLADRAARVQYSFGLLDVVETAATAQRDVSEVATLYYLLSERFRVDWLLSKISLLPREDRWQTLARSALRYDLYAALAALTAEALGPAVAPSPIERRAEEWEQANVSSVARARRAMDDFAKSPADLAALSVMLRQIRTLVRTSSAAT